MRNTRAHLSVYNAIMEAMRQSWTDERLDAGFERVDAEINAVRGELSSFRAETNSRFDRLESRFDRFEDRLDNLHRILFQVGGGMAVGLIGLLATLIGIIAVKL